MGVIAWPINWDQRIVDGKVENINIAKEAWGPRVPWNPDFEVHHMDAKRDHNCRSNLLILPSVLHHASAGYNKRKRNGRST